MTTPYLPPSTYGAVALQPRDASQPCAWAACREAGTSIAGEWWFCDRHARQHEAMESGDDPDGEDLTDDLLPPRASGHGTEARWQQHNRAGEQPCRDCMDAHTRARHDRRTPAMTTPTGASGIGLLLEQASAHGSGKVNRLGSKIEALLDDLRVLMKESEAQEVARQEVARLERQLAEAKARMRGKPTAVPSGPRDDSASGINRNLEPLECRKGCGKISAGAQGRAGHERFCQHVAVAS